MNEHSRVFDNLNLYERVYRYLKDKIISKELRPGSRLNYEELCKELGVSKTPLRDAVNRLHADGLIEIRPRSGTYISIPKQKDIKDIYNVRRALECEAVRTATFNMPEEQLIELLKQVEYAEKEILKGNYEPFFDSDKALHGQIVRTSNNLQLIKFMEMIETQIRWIGVIITNSMSRPLEASEMHKKILHAMLSRDAEQAMKYMEEHINRIRDMTLSDYS